MSILQREFYTPQSLASTPEGKAVDALQAVDALRARFKRAKQRHRSLTGGSLAKLDTAITDAAVLCDELAAAIWWDDTPLELCEPRAALVEMQSQLDNWRASLLFRETMGGLRSTAGKGVA